MSLFHTSVIVESFFVQFHFNHLRHFGKTWHWQYSGILKSENEFEPRSLVECWMLYFLFGLCYWLALFNVSYPSIGLYRVHNTLCQCWALRWSLKMFHKLAKNNFNERVLCCIFMYCIDSAIKKKNLNIAFLTFNTTTRNNQFKTFAPLKRLLLLLSLESHNKYVCACYCTG